MKKNELFYPSFDKQTNIHMVMWEPDDEVLGVIQIVHGITEHIMRYEEMAKYYTDKGLAVVGIDLLGHGLSTNNGQKVMYFGPSGSWNYALEDVRRCFVHAKEMYPDVPYTMLGFSLGSFLVRTFMIESSGLVDGIVLVGTGYTSDFEIKIAQSIVKKEEKKYGDNVATDKIRSLTFGTYNKKFAPNKTDYDWLCASPLSLEEYINDSLRGENITVGLFRELLAGMKLSSNKQAIMNMTKVKPMLLLSGSMDPVGNFGKGVEKAYRLYKDAGFSDIEFKLYDSLRHDILHEDIHEKIFDDLYEWIKKRKLLKEKTPPKVAVKPKTYVNKSVVTDGKRVSSVLTKSRGM